MGASRGWRVGWTGWLLIALGAAMFTSCITRRQCVNTCVDTCKAAMRYQAGECTSSQIRKDADCAVQKLDLDTCREEIKALQSVCQE